MGLKILHSADWHLDTPFAGFCDEKRNRLKRELRKVPGRILELAHAEKVDLLLLSGDLFDGQGSRESVNLVYHTLRELGVPVFVSPGNHDCCTPGSAWLEESWPENVHVFTGTMGSVSLPELSCRVYGAGYQSMDCPPLLENFRAEGEERYCIAVLHGDPVTRNSPCCAITEAQVRESGLNYLALGHIHRAGSFRAGETLCAWPGCPMGRGWDETGEKGAFIVDLENSAQVRWINLDFPQFHAMEVELAGEAEDSLTKLLPAARSEDFYRITLTGWGEVDLDGLYSRFFYLPNLELRNRTQKIQDLWTDAEKDSLRGTYFRLLKASENPKARLAAEISRRLLAGMEVPLP